MPDSASSGHGHAHRFSSLTKMKNKVRKNFSIVPPSSNHPGVASHQHGAALSPSRVHDAPPPAFRLRVVVPSWTRAGPGTPTVDMCATAESGSTPSLTRELHRHVRRPPRDEIHATMMARPAFSSLLP